MRAPVSAASAMLLAFFVFVLGELDDQDGVLGGEADQHDEADLRVDVVFKASQPERGVRAEDGDGRAEQNAERQRPAFILRGQNQKNEEQRQAENRDRGNALRGLLFLVRHAELVVSPFRAAWFERKLPRALCVAWPEL